MNIFSLIINFLKGENKMDFIALLGELKAKIEAIEAEIEAIKKEQYDLGFEAGKAQAGVEGFTQEQVDALVLAAVEPVKAELEALKLEVDSKVEAAKAEVVLIVKESIEAVESTEALLKQKLGL